MCSRAVHSKLTADEVAEAIGVIDELLRWKDPADLLAIRSVDHAIRRLARKQEPDLSTAEGFAEWILSLAFDLRIADRAAFERALDQLRPIISVNWPALSETEVEEALTDVRNLVILLRNRATAAQIPILEQVANQAILGSMRDHVRRYDLDWVPTLTPSDLAEQNFLVNSTANFLRAQDGRIADEVSRKAREIVAQGMRENVGRAEIASRLEQAFGAAQTPNYYELIAGQFMSRAQAWGALRSYQESGVKLAEIMAVLDERTSDICRFLDGKYISVDGSLDIIQRTEAATGPEDVKTLNPWLREGQDDNGKFLYVQKPDGQIIRIADIDRSGFGNVDDKGEFSNAMNSAQLQVLGIGPPPYHAHCRSTLVPVLEEPG